KFFGNRRLLLEDIEPGSLQNARLQCINQRALINNRTTRGIDQNATAFHHFKLALADKVTSLRVEWAMNAYEIGLLQQLIKRNALSPQRAFHERNCCAALIVNGIHAKAESTQRHSLSDATETDDAERFPSRV